MSYEWLHGNTPLSQKTMQELGLDPTAEAKAEGKAGCCDGAEGRKVLAKASTAAGTATIPGLVGTGTALFTWGVTATAGIVSSGCCALMLIWGACRANTCIDRELNAMAESPRLSNAQLLSASFKAGVVGCGPVPCPPDAAQLGVTLNAPVYATAPSSPSR